MDETDPRSDADRAPIETVGVDRLTDAVVDAFAQAGLRNGTPRWPDDEPRYRVRTPAADPDVKADALAAVLDASPRNSESAFLCLTVGRQSGLTGRRRFELETLSGYGDVTVSGDHTAGTVPVTAETFAAVVTLADEVAYLVVRDADGVAIAEWREETVRFAVPGDGVETVKAGLEAATADRIERD